MNRKICGEDWNRKRKINRVKTHQTSECKTNEGEDGVRIENHRMASPEALSKIEAGGAGRGMQLDNQ